jgi:TolB-like protein
MHGQEAMFRLDLIGAFRMTYPSGERVPLTGKRAKALLALLATARNGEHSRAWLQERLWGSRDQTQAQASLRRELSNLRPLINTVPTPLLVADHERVALNLDIVTVDARDPAFLRVSQGDFLEGLDLAGEDTFEDWLREQRQRIDAERSAGPAEGWSALVAPDAGHQPVGFGGRPALTVLPFAEGEEAVDRRVWIEGIADDLSDRLSRLRWLPVIAAPFGSLTREDIADPSRLRRLLGADYVLHCRLAGPTDRLVLQLRLVETATGRLLWTERTPLENQVTHGLLDRVADSTVAALSTRIETEQQIRVSNRNIEELTVDELVWRARWHMRRLTRRDSEIAAELLERAARDRPNAADILVQQAFALGWRIWSTRGSREEIEGLRALALRAKDSDPFDARSHLIAGIAEMWLAQHDSARSLLLEALALNPSLANAHGHLGSCYSLSGQPEKAFIPLRTALRLSPLDTEAFHQFGELALANFMLERHDEAVTEADFALARRPAYFYAHVIKIAALSALGARAQVRSAHGALLEAKPGFDPSALDWLPFKDRAWIRRIKQALAEAGAG